MNPEITGPKRLSMPAATAAPASPPSPPPNAVSAPKSDDIYASTTDTTKAPLTVMKVVLSRPILLCQKNSLNATAPRRKIRTKLPRPKHPATRKWLQRYPSFPPILLTSTSLSILSGCERRLWSTSHVNRYDTVERRVRRAKTNTITPVTFRKFDFLSGFISEKNEKRLGFSFFFTFFIFFFAGMATCCCAVSSFSC